MRKLFKILSVSMLITSACESGKNEIFWISDTDGDENDFLFMAESTNIPEIQRDSLIYYVTNEEMLSAEKLTFKNFGKIYSNAQFNVYVLLKEGSDTGRDYSFIIRTFDKNFKIINSYEFASWIDAESKYCHGSIDEDLIIKRICKYGKGNDVRQITNDGRIIATSFHGLEKNN